MKIGYHKLVAILLIMVVQAGLSAGAMIPIVGDLAFKGGKYALKAYKVYKAAKIAEATISASHNATHVAENAAALGAMAKTFRNADPHDVAKALESMAPMRAAMRAGAGDKYAAKLLDGGTGRAFAGHGELRYGMGEVVVPEGTSITIWTKPGMGIPDELGQAIERGDYLSIMKDPDWMKIVEGASTHLPGSKVANYTLKAPSSPTRPLTIYKESITVEDATSLSDLLKPNMGNMNWAACTIYRY